MTQTAAIDLSALAARSASSYQSTRKTNADFGAAFDNAASQQREVERSRDNARQDAQEADRDRQDNQPVDRNDQPSKPDAVDHHQQASKKDDTQETTQAKSNQADKAADKADAKQAAADQTANKAADKAAEKAADKADAKQAATDKAEAKPDQQAKDDKSDKPVDPQAQAVLALLLATPVALNTQVNQPQATAQAAQPQTQAVAATPADAKAQAQAQLLAQMQAATATDAKAQAQTPAQAAQAQAQTPAAAAQAQTQATAQVSQTQTQTQLQALLATAGKDLGKVTVQTDTKPQATAAAAPKGQMQAPVNLMVQLLEAVKAQEIPNGSNTQAVTLDGAKSAEMSSQLANLPQLQADQKHDDAGDTQPDTATLTPLLNTDAHAHVENGKVDAPQAQQAQVKTEDVMPQILKHMDAIKAQQANSIKLQLYPEHLGKIEIKVMTHNGVLSAQISADNQQVKGLLDNQMVTLQHALAELGLKVDKVEVALSSANLGFDSSGAQAQTGGQLFQQQQQQAQSQGVFRGSGYQQWIGDEPTEEAYADLGDSTAINYVA